MRLYLTTCRDCQFEKTRRNGKNAENLAKSHEGQTGHIVSVRGPFYEARGNERWECELCGYKNTRAEMAEKHVREEHDIAQAFIKKIGVDDD